MLRVPEGLEQLSGSKDGDAWKLPAWAPQHPHPTFHSRPVFLLISLCRGSCRNLPTVNERAGSARLVPLCTHNRKRQNLPARGEWGQAVCSCNRSKISLLTRRQQSDRADN